jgi:hypothetical protein
MSADGDGVLVTVAQSLPWMQVAAGGIAPARVWTTTDWGERWERGRMLPPSGGIDNFVGAISVVFTEARGWVGWMVAPEPSDGIETITGAGGTLTSLRGAPAATNVQLLTWQTGYAWALEPQYGNSAVTLVLSGTRDAGRRWQSTRVDLPALAASTASGPLVYFTTADHGWIVLGGRTWHTSDAGRTWRQAAPAARHSRQPPRRDAGVPGEAAAGNVGAIGWRRGALQLQGEPAQRVSHEMHPARIPNIAPADDGHAGTRRAGILQPHLQRQIRPGSRPAVPTSTESR